MTVAVATGRCASKSPTRSASPGSCSAKPPRRIRPGIAASHAFAEHAAPGLIDLLLSRADDLSGELTVEPVSRFGDLLKSRAVDVTARTGGTRVGPGVRGATVPQLPDHRGDVAEQSAGGRHPHDRAVADPVAGYRPRPGCDRSWSVGRGWLSSVHEHLPLLLLRALLDDSETAHSDHPAQRHDRGQTATSSTHRPRRTPRSRRTHRSQARYRRHTASKRQPRQPSALLASIGIGIAEKRRRGFSNCTARAPTPPVLELALREYLVFPTARGPLETEPQDRQALPWKQSRTDVVDALRCTIFCASITDYAMQLRIEKWLGVRAGAHSTPHNR